MLKRKLLLADDSITIQKVVNLTFADEGIEVISVGDGDSAMEKIGEYAPDLILADVNMPGLNGYQICERIKQSAATQKIPVILLVGSFEPFDESEAYRVGADDYLTKPFQSIRQLVTKVSELLESSSANSEQPETPDNLSESENETENINYINTVEISRETLDETEQFGDAGFDDEMIESSQVGSLPVDDIQKFIADSTAGINSSTSDQGQHGLEFKSYQNYEAEDDFAKTEPLNIEDLRSFSSESEGERSNASVYEITADEPENEQLFENDVAETSYEQQSDAEFSSNWTSAVNLDNNVIEENQNEDLAETNDLLDYPAEHNTLQLDDFSADANSSDSPNFSFDDLDLLDLPPLAPRQTPNKTQLTAEPETEYQIQYQSETDEEPNEQLIATEETIEFENQPNRAEPEKLAESDENTTSVEPETEIDRQIAAMSPELIEAIARRVAEKISDKAVREIAWEVVPQMTDLIVRRMAEEKFKE